MHGRENVVLDYYLQGDTTFGMVALLHQHPNQHLFIDSNEWNIIWDRVHCPTWGWNPLMA